MRYYFLGFLHVLCGELERNLQQRVYEHHRPSYLVEIQYTYARIVIVRIPVLQVSH